MKSIDRGSDYRFSSCRKHRCQFVHECGFAGAIYTINGNA
jgi:hypothetical protein